MSTQPHQPDLTSVENLRRSFEQHNRLSASLAESLAQLNTTAGQIQPDSDRSAQQLRALIDAIPGGVVVLDPQGLVVESNATAVNLLGEPLNCQPWRDVVHRVFLTDLDQGELKTDDGHQYSISTRPLGYAPGQILLLSDVTQTRQLQRAAQQNLHLMTMGKMMASLAHQIRTPLASTMLYLSQVVEGDMDPDTSQLFSEKALARTKHIEKMINDMLVFAHGGRFNMSQFSIGELIRELRDQLRPQLEQCNAQLNISGAELQALLRGNRDALLGALGNLCMNALDAADQPAVISIKISFTLRGMLSIAVQDYGCGFDSTTRKHLFDPFFSTKEDGTGLGLAVVKSVIESHQGRIAVASRPGKGCRFRIFLPCEQGLRSQVSSNEA
ncbi:MAG: PAS domain-containing protein [Gammaproteobacteria bacterium]|nr:PAS domain-containing protein [Gammaproteobacteria bacterium]